jgi:hypothetical protein
MSFRPGKAHAQVAQRFLRDPAQAQAYAHFTAGNAGRRLNAGDVGVLTHLRSYILAARLIVVYLPAVRCAPEMGIV